MISRHTPQTLTDSPRPAATNGRHGAAQPASRAWPILLRPSGALRFTLAPGDCVVFDNTRILHSRTGFSAAGRRHLQGCYADIDGVESTVAMLARSCSRKAG